MALRCFDLLADVAAFRVQPDLAALLADAERIVGRFSPLDGRTSGAGLASRPAFVQPLDDLRGKLGELQAEARKTARQTVGGRAFVRPHWRAIFAEVRRPSDTLAVCGRPARGRAGGRSAPPQAAPPAPRRR